MNLGIVNTIPGPLSVILGLPLIVDWLVQWLGVAESTNTRRFVTGFLFGFALAPQGVTIEL